MRQHVVRSSPGASRKFGEAQPDYPLLRFLFTARSQLSTYQAMATHCQRHTNAFFSNSGQIASSPPFQSFT
jgi:hypothetical protein